MAGPMHLSRVRGFSLIEMAVVLVILAIVAAGMLVFGNARSVSGRYQSDRARMERIDEAVRQYVRRHGLVPCPAPTTLPPGSSAFGLPSDCSATVAGTIDVTSPSSTQSIRWGSLPVVALNLPAEFIADSWGRRYLYGMVRNLGLTPSTFTAYAATAATTANGVIVVNDKDASGQQIVDAGQVVAYVVVGHGQNGLGGLPVDGGTMAACSGTSLDVPNCDYDAVVVDRAFSDSATSSLRFDDMLRWDTYAHLK